MLFSNEDLLTVAENLMSQGNPAIIQDMPVDGMGFVCRDKCEAGNELISIAANGDVYPCHMLQTPGLKLGSLADRKQSLEEIVFSDRNPFQSLSCNMIEGCKECGYKALCGGGCRGRSYLYHENITSPDAYCEFIKAFYKMSFSMLKEKLSNAIAKGN